METCLISNPNLIFVGQQLKVNNDNNGQAVAQQNTNNNAQAAQHQPKWYQPE